MAELELFLALQVHLFNMLEAVVVVEEQSTPTYQDMVLQAVVLVDHLVDHLPFQMVKQDLLTQVVVAADH